MAEKQTCERCERLAAALVCEINGDTCGLLATSGQWACTCRPCAAYRDYLRAIQDDT